MSAKLFRRFLFALALIPSPAFGHTSAGDTHGFVHGLLHPLGGLDHILAMVAVGLLAAQLGSRALWLVPAGFLAAMAFAGLLGATGVPLSFVETGIACSVIGLGLMIVFGARPPLAAAIAIVGAFALFHGHAHGAEIPEQASGLAYGAGFVLATALLHIAGIGLGLALARRAEFGGVALQLVGGAMSLAGAAMLVGLI